MSRPLDAAIVRLNVGGAIYHTALPTLLADPNSLLASHFGGTSQDESSLATIQPDGSYFIDRDGQLFRYVLDYLRTNKLVLPDPFNEHSRLREEAKFFDLKAMVKLLNKNDTLHPTTGSATNGGYVDRKAGYITIGYRGTFAFGRDGQADVKFRKLNRILVCGKAALCREVFGESLNESRDPDREGSERYTARLYLKHQSLEKACDALAEKGFKLSAACASGANGLPTAGPGFPSMPPTGSGSQDQLNPRSSGDYEEQRWSHYTEFIFCRQLKSVS